MSLIYSEQVGGRRHGLYLGGKTDAKARDQLERWGVTHILNVTPPKEGIIQAGVPNYFETKFKYKRISVYDASTSDLLQHADDVVAFISSGLCHGSVLVHCQRGVSRSSTCVAFYLMRKAGMNLKDCMALVQQKRPQADPIPAFLTQLQEYEKRCIDMGAISNDSKRKIGNSTNKPPRKKRAIGPASQSTKRVIGPSLPPPAIKESDSESEKDSKPAVVSGPQLPDPASAAVAKGATAHGRMEENRLRGEEHKQRDEEQRDKRT